ncbi:NAC domain-containing protein 2 [Ziziphus jujuba]|uniref:NAC domain-containing protein 2 n=2 Tax=Ziziphus jujuba TaxID=326968 RepID=A0A6P6GKC2_ZIZJJ|nr:NAC domain-containing protein 2 [Ziziphus jujuba]KAH7544639.1 hypothetical protein FEM48_Zijuj01G0007100 [Ziziphus jujuba var. spinosa]
MDVHQNRDVVENPSINSNNNSPINSSSGNSPPPTNNENLHHHVHDDNDDDQQPTTKYCEQVSKYLPGFRFNPKDEELVDFYLKKKVANEQLPSNVVIDVELYKFNPEYLAENHKPRGENQWFFFTPRDRKYPNGERPNRAAGSGYWKATGADRPVVSNEDKIGFRKALVFYQGKAPNGVKTDWIMHEYRLNQPSKRKRIGNDMRLDDWVLCRIYKKPNKSPSKNERKVEENHHGVHERHAKKSISDTSLITSSPSEDYNEALIPSSSQNHNSNNNNNAYDHRHMINPNPRYPELQRINIHQNPNFMERQPPRIPPLPPATYFQQHHQDLTNPNPGLTMDENAFRGLEPLSSSLYHSTGIKSEDDSSFGYHYQHDDAYGTVPSLLYGYNYGFSPNMDTSLDHSVMRMDNTDNVIDSFTSHRQV